MASSGIAARSKGGNGAGIRGKSSAECPPSPQHTAALGRGWRGAGLGWEEERPRDAGRAAMGDGELVGREGEYPSQGGSGHLTRLLGGSRGAQRADEGVGMAGKKRGSPQPLPSLLCPLHLLGGLLVNWV